MAKRKRSYGSGQVVPPRKPGGLWAVRVREGGKRRYVGGLESRDMAERMLARVAGEAAAGRSGLPQQKRDTRTIGELAEGFLERRELTHRAGKEDVWRWKKHVAPHVGHLRPVEVDTSHVRSLVVAMLRQGLANGTAAIAVSLLSSLFAELREQGLAGTNPARDLPRSIRRMLKSKYDPRSTPFIEKLDDVWRVFYRLPKPLNIGFALGAFAGLRPGEAFALRWSNVDIANRRILVHESVTGETKDKESRVVLILDPLLPVLTKWKLESGGEGLLVPPLRRDGEKVDKATRGTYLARALAELKLTRAGLGWYECTRHTFASQWVLAGGSIAKLKELLGHYSVVETERYAHLRPDLFTKEDLALLPRRATPPEASKIGQQLGSAASKRRGRGT